MQESEYLRTKLGEKEGKQVVIYMFYFNAETKQNPCRDREHTFIITVVQACKTQKKSSAHIKRCFSCSGLCEPVSHLLSSLPFKIHGIHWPGDMRRMMVLENCLRKRY